MDDRVRSGSEPPEPGRDETGQAHAPDGAGRTAEGRDPDERNVPGARSAEPRDPEPGGAEPSTPEPAAAHGPSEATASPPPFLERRVAPDARRLRPPTPRVALLIAAAIVVAVVIYMGREALSPFIVGLLIVYLLDPPVDWLARRRVPRWLAVLVVYVVAIFVVFEALNLTLRPLVDQIATFINDLPTIAQDIDVQLRRLSEFYRGLQLPPELRDAIDGWIAGLADGGVSFDPSVLLPVVNVTAGLVGAIFGYIIIPVWVFYLLKDRPALTGAFDRALPSTWRADVWHVIHIVERVFSQWVRGQIFLGVTVGIATFLGLLLLGATVDPIFTRFAVLLAIIAGLLELLPIIGPIIAAVPAVVLAATAGVEAVVAALLLYLIVQQVENNLLVPKIQGEAVELHPSAVMFALVMGGAIGGLLGAILALPVTAAGRDVFRYLFMRLSPSPPTPAAAAAESVGSVLDERDAPRRARPVSPGEPGPRAADA